MCLRYRYVGVGKEDNIGEKMLVEKAASKDPNTHTHTHTYIYIYDSTWGPEEEGQTAREEDAAEVFKDFEGDLGLVLVLAEEAGERPGPETEALRTDGQGGGAGGLLVDGVVEVVETNFRGVGEGTLASDELGGLHDGVSIEDFGVVWAGELGRAAVVVL